LTLRDLVLTQILCVVGSGWVGVAAGLGRAQAVVWIAAMALFYLPMAVSVFYLNREMPLEGGLYVWARTAFGDTWGFITAWNLWAYGLCVCATILFGIPTEMAYLIGPKAAWLPENHFASLGLLAIILAALTASALRGLALGRWIHNVSGAGMVAVFALLMRRFLSQCRSSISTPWR
jgi:amino acid transporter